MAQKRFHPGVEHMLYDEGADEPCARVELLLRYRYPTSPKFRDDDVLILRLLNGVRENFFHGIVYEIAGPGGIRTRVKYVKRRPMGNRVVLIFRRMRRFAKARAK